jgi:hypothetical protein
MTIPTAAQQKIDAYLKTLREGLSGLGDEDARDVVEEIRSHILDKAAVGGDIAPAAVASAIAALGTAEELASQYVTDDLLMRARISRSPWVILRSLFRWASLSLAGFFVLISSLAGYLLAGSFVLCALLKPIHPQAAGLWRLPDPEDVYSFSLRLGFGPPPTGGKEILGWWIIPIGLIIGMGFVLLTFRFGLWSLRKFWRPRRLPGLSGAETMQ